MNSDGTSAVTVATCAKLCALSFAAGLAVGFVLNKKVTPTLFHRPSLSG
jgi:hypothetical protein